MSEYDVRQALASATVSPGLHGALANRAIVPVVGADQLWRIRIDDAAMLVLALSAVDAGQVLAAAVTVSTAPPADSGVVTLPVPTEVLRQALVWPGVQRSVPLRAFDVSLDDGGHLTGTAATVRRAVQVDPDPLDPGLLLQAELHDDLDRIAASPGLPVWQDTAVLKNRLPGTGASQLAAVQAALGVGQAQAMALLRGTLSLSAEQAAAVEEAFGLDPDSLAVAEGYRPDVVAELDQPRHKAVIVALASHRRCSELDIRTEAAQRERALAARSTAGADLAARIAYVLGLMQ